MDNEFIHLHGNKSNTLNMKSFNFFETIIPSRTKKIHQIVFFTKPKCNLSTEQLKNEREMATLVTKSSNTVEAYVRNMLDPYLKWEDKNVSEGKVKKEPLLNKLNTSDTPFIPIMTNMLNSLSGFPDIAPTTWSAEEGVRKETWGYMNGWSYVYEKRDINATFARDDAGVMEKLISMWVKYSTLVAEGTFAPRMEELLGGRIDYQTGIYNLILAPNKRKILGWAKTIGFPKVNPRGEMFNYKRGEGKTFDEINTIFEIYGMEYNDPIILKEFNEVVGLHNGGLRLNSNGKYKGEYLELPDSLLEKGMEFAVPYINLDYGTLEWLIHKDKLQLIK